MAEREGWDPGLRDGDLIGAVSPAGFLVVTDTAGSMRGGLIDTEWNPGLHFIGLFIITEESRGRGLGRELLDACLQSSDAVIHGLDAVPAQVGHYKAIGFRATRDTLYYEGVWRGIGTRDRDMARIEIVPVDSAARQRIIDADSSMGPGRRERYLSTWFQQPGHRIAACLQEGELGWICARESRMGLRVGPLVAPSRDAAVALLDEVVPRGTTFSIFSPELGPLRAMVADLGLQSYSKTTRMWRGAKTPNEDVDRVYGIAGPELG